ncbi:MAG: hypothetical protein LBB04_00425 [Oscillospiraceae bacterium]|nr:hypothetical protein [Oscillospiraceae bacterium]
MVRQIPSLIYVRHMRAISLQAKISEQKAFDFRNRVEFRNVFSNLKTATACGFKVCLLVRMLIIDIHADS